MKIIGLTDGGVILEATNTELANLAGLYSEFSVPEFRSLKRIGATLDVSALFQHRRSMDEANKEISKCATMLRAAADMMEHGLPKLTPEEQKENSNE